MENAVISDEKKFLAIKELFKKQGVSKIHIISDFDRTITRAFVNGERIPSIISLLRKENYIDEDYSKRASELADKYHPIELSNKISIAEKKEKMKEWWEKHFDLLIEKKLHKSHILQAVNSGKMKMREDFKEIIQLAHKHKVPFIIFSSAGLGKESISLFLEREKCLLDNVFIISNEFVWNKEGIAVEIKKPIIHVLNKNETSLPREIKENIAKRENLILFGDSIGDLGMSAGGHFKNIFKIGFLNENIEENLEDYKKNFDVIILNDYSAQFILEFLKEVV